MKVECLMEPYSPYVNEILINFPEIPVGCKTTETIKICNEYNLPVKFKWSRHPDTSNQNGNTKFPYTKLFIYNKLFNFRAVNCDGDFQNVFENGDKRFGDAFHASPDVIYLFFHIPMRVF